jgi:N-acyl-D-glutamate deacylase
MNRRTFLCGLTLGTLAAPLAAEAQQALLGARAARASETPAQFDLVVRGGRVIDPESGFDEVRDIGIRDGRIALIAKQKLVGRKILDAFGSVVAPGFIDLHSHAVQLLAARVQAHDGVTTALELEGGMLDVPAFYDRIASRGWPINYGASASWALARLAAGKDVSPPTAASGLASLAELELASPEQSERVRVHLERALDDGALGIGILLGYAPKTGYREFADINRWAAARGVPTFTHVRFHAQLEPQSAFEAFQEAIAVAAGTGVHLHLCHVNSASGRMAPLVLADVAKAQAQGLRVTVEAYPYGAGAAAIGAAFLRDDELRRSGMKKEDFTHDGKALTAEEFDRLRTAAPRTRIVVPFLYPDTDPKDRAILDASILFPGGAIASDAQPWRIEGRDALTFADIWPLPEDALSHPRAAGTFSRFLRIYVRERQAISLRDALAKTSLIPARILERSVPQMRRKGRIAKGMDADLVVFALATIADRATYEKPAQTSTGIRHVIVAGVPVIENGILDPKSRPGQPVRRRQAR